MSDSMSGNVIKDETEEQRRARVVMVLGFLGGVFISGISIFDFFVRDDRPLGLVLALIITGITFIAHSIYIKLGGKPKLYLLIFLMVVLHSFWLFSGVGARAGILWSLVMLPTFFYFLGHKNGAIVTGVLFVVTAYLLTFPPGMLPLAEFTEQLSQRYLMAYLVLSFSCFSIEVIHFDVRKGFYSAKEELNSLAKTDQLTGLNNRRGFLENISEDQRKGGNKDNFSMVLIDLDHFKQVNDKHGHLVGDKVLVEASSLIKSCVRGDDVVTRWGGEEIVVFMPATNVYVAHKVAERICHSIASYSFGGLGISMTASCGVAESNSPFQDSTDVVKMADRAMFKAKHSGRNRVVTL
jgi:diguanylate cyclase (GGDEF)-like protein